MLRPRLTLLLTQLLLLELLLLKPVGFLLAPPRLGLLLQLLLLEQPRLGKLRRLRLRWLLARVRLSGALRLIGPAVLVCSAVLIAPAALAGADALHALHKLREREALALFRNLGVRGGDCGQTHQNGKQRPRAG